MKNISFLIIFSATLSSMVQAQYVQAKYIGVKYNLQGCQREADDVRCVLNALYTGNEENTLLKIGDADTSGLVSGKEYEPHQYDVGGNGAAIVGSIGKVYKTTPTQVSFVFSGLPRNASVINVLNVQGALFKNVKISSTGATSVKVDRSFLDQYQVVLNNCALSAGNLVCAGVTLTPKK